MPVRNLAGIVCAVLGMASCAPSPAPATPSPVVRINDDALEIDGRLQTGTAQRVKDLLRHHPSVRRLVIASTGGSSLESWEIGRIVHDRQFTVELAGLCASACTDVFLAGNAGQSIRPGAVLAFHTTQWTMVYAASRSEFAPVAWPKPDGAEFEADFLQHIGISLSLQKLAARVSHPTCVARVGPAERGLRSFAIESVHTLFVPSRRLLAALGANDIKGYIPENEEEMRQLLGHYPINPAASIAFADVDALNLPIPEGPFPRCPWNVPGQMPPGYSLP